MSDVRTFLAELRRRRVIPTAVVYAALAWGAIEVVTTVLPVFGGRDVVVRIIVAAILLGLPVAIVISWLFDFTPSGFRRDEGAPGPARAASPGAAAAALAHDVISRPPPAPANALLGREAELEEVVALLSGQTRVLTITGPGGTGKTRLAIAVAERLRESFKDGVAYLELTTITDAHDVVPAIAAAVGVKEAESRSLAEGLATIIADRRVLLVLDNLEQVIDAAPDLAALLRQCPSLCLLGTSRFPLRIAGEAEFPLRPLALPPVGVTPALEDLETYAAVELFLDRTRRARPGFRLTDQNAAIVLQICRRLDGLPLALELAAARLRTLEPETLLPRLEHALDVLTAGARDLPERQRTLRATIDWSHSLLNECEQRLFRRLAVFAGDWRQQAVAPVCYAGETDRSLDELESLVEKGLVQQVEHGARFGMLETIREYAAERLAASGEEVRLRRLHAEYCSLLAEQLYADFRTPAQLESLRQGDVEEANFEAALEHLYQAASLDDAGALHSGLRLSGDLWMYWHIRGRHLRARQWSRAFLELPAGNSFPAARARVLVAACVASMTLGDVEGALAEAREGEEALAREPNPETGVLLAISFGVAYLTAGAIGNAQPWLEEAVRRGRAVGQPWELGLALGFLGIVETASGNAEVARGLFEEALAMLRAIDDRQGLGTALGGLAAIEAAAGRPEQALALYDEALTAYHECGDRPEEARILDALAWTSLALDRTDDARQYFAESLRAYEDVGSVRGIGIALLGLAATQVAENQPERALRIAAAAEACSQQLGVANEYARHTAAPRYLDAARAAVAVAEIPRLEAEGRAMSLREAVRYALARYENSAVALARP